MPETIAFKRARLGGPTNKQVFQANEILKRRKAAELKAEGKTLVQCTTQTATGKGCLAWFPINQLEYIQTHYYVSPHGCTGGDYWLAGEGEWYCPACSHRNRLYATPEVAKMKRSFKSVKDTY